MSLTMKEYLDQSARTASVEFVSFKNFENGPQDVLMSEIKMIDMGNVADGLKRSMFYHSPADKVEERFQKATNELRSLQAITRATPVGVLEEVNLHHAMLGIMSEAAEVFTELIQSQVQARKVNKVNLREELGDLLWYMALAIRELDGETFESVGEINLNKLKARYPEKFNSDQAHNRDLSKENEILSGGLTQ